MRNQSSSHNQSQFSTETAEVLARIQPILEERGVAPEELELDGELEEDLSLDIRKDMPIIINKINNEFSIELDIKTVLSEVSTVGELVDLIIEEKTLLS